MSEQTIALLVAAGKSERMQMDVPKPYLQLGEENLMGRTVSAFLNHPDIDGVRVVIRREHHAQFKRATEGLTMFPCVIGGNTRQESVRLGLESIAHRKPEYVLVHDIARPMVSPELITRVCEALKTQTAVIPSLSITDTVRRMESGKSETVNRDNLYTIQTPQGFHYEMLLAAHLQCKGQNLTDDAAVVEKSGGRVTLVEGEKNNIKITTKADLDTMQAFFSQNFETHVGMGFDVHQLKLHDAETPAGKQHIKICGIAIPFTHFLVGHSDADVGLHAVVDAILGALGDGDIGTHFSPDDRRWQGADSSRFLIHAYELLKQRRGELMHLDVTIIGERPKIAPYREQMVAHVAQLLKLRSSRISIKATTTEKLGFTGRGEGVAAQAVATIRLPGE